MAKSPREISTQPEAAKKKIPLLRGEFEHQPVKTLPEATNNVFRHVTRPDHSAAVVRYDRSTRWKPEKKLATSR